jgi:hypothetical protein
VFLINNNNQNLIFYPRFQCYHIIQYIVLLLISNEIINKFATIWNFLSIHVT